MEKGPTEDKQSRVEAPDGGAESREQSRQAESREQRADKQSIPGGRARWRRSQAKMQGRKGPTGSTAGADGQMQGRLRGRGGRPVDTSRVRAQRRSRYVRRLLSSPLLARTRGE